MHDKIIKSATLADQAREYTAGILSIAVSLAVTIASLLLISKYVSFPVDLLNREDVFLVQTGNFSPEPLERALFLSGIIIFSLTLFISLKLIKTWTGKVRETQALKLSRILYVATIIAAALLVWFDFRVDDIFLIYTAAGNPLETITRDATGCNTSSSGLAGLNLLAIILITAVTAFLYRIAVKGGNNKTSKYFRILLDILSFAMILASVLLCIYGMGKVSYSVVYSYHLNSVFYSVVQVYHGKELLYDLTNLYGLYPHFIEPLFRIIGLGLLNFTVLMGLLMGLSFFLIYRFLTEAVESKVLARLGFLTCFFYCYIYSKLSLPAVNDPYFQYTPIRYIFPAASIFLVYRYLRDGGKKLYYALFFLFSMGVLWNFDTGFFVLTAWLMVLIFGELYPLKPRAIAAHILKGLSVFVLTFALFTLYMSIRYGHIPQYQYFFKYQNVFLKYGFYMLPMKPLHPWNLVMLAYALGLLYSFRSVVYGRVSLTAKTTFYLTVLGVGLFIYYQGRSHDQNLGIASYPAVLLLALFADIFIKKVRDGGNFFNRAATGGIIFVMAFSTASLVYNFPALGVLLKTHLNGKPNKVQGNPVLRQWDDRPTVVMENIEFINKYTSKGDKPVIFSLLGSIYYLESGTSSPVKIPGCSELYLISDYQELIRYLEKMGPGSRVFYDTSLFTIDDYFKNNYIVMDTNGSMQLLLRIQ